MRLRGDAPRELPDRDRNPVAAIASNERDERVRAAVLALPDDQRSAIALRLWGELEYEQIAELELSLQWGRYRVEWFDPKTGKVVHQDKFNHNGGPFYLKTPSFQQDLALKLLREF